ncbi:MAG: hypothetical protein AAFQ98_10140, partial [Bacteroidota bacterium]
MSAYELEILSAVGSGASILPSGAAVVYAEVEHQVNKIPRAVIRLSEGRTNQGEFLYASKAAFAPGAALKLAVTPEKKAKTVLFVGIIVRTQFVETHHGPLFELELRDPAIRLTHQRQHRVFKTKS